MKYVVDKIENKIALLEGVLHGDKKEVNIDKLPYGIKENDVLTYDDNSYVIDEKEKEKRIRRIRQKMEKLKKTRK
jgi:hypothetical protein